MSFFHPSVSFFFSRTRGTQEEDALLTIPGSDAAPVVTPRHTWLEHPVLKDSFWYKALNELVEANSAFEYRISDSSGSGTLLGRQVYRTLFGDNGDEEGSVIPLWFVLRMRVEREEVPFFGITFESKMQRHQAFDKWAARVLALPR